MRFEPQSNRHDAAAGGCATGGAAEREQTCGRDWRDPEPYAPRNAGLSWGFWYGRSTRCTHLLESAILLPWQLPTCMGGDGARNGEVVGHPPTLR